MMTQTDNKQMKFHLVTIENLVPEDHFLRKLDCLVDFSFIYEEIEGFYCQNNGRPSVDPVILMKYLLIGFLFGIESERRIEQEIQVNMGKRAGGWGNRLNGFHPCKGKRFCQKEYQGPGAQRSEQLHGTSGFLRRAGTSAVRAIRPKRKIRTPMEKLPIEKTINPTIRKLLTVPPVYPKGWKSAPKRHYSHALGFVVKWRQNRRKGDSMALTIQERLKDLRVERGLTLEQLAEQTQLSKSALGSYEAGFWPLCSPFSRHQEKKGRSPACPRPTHQHLSGKQTEEEKQWLTRMIVQKSELAKSYVPQRGKKK